MKSMTGAVIGLVAMLFVVGCIHQFDLAENYDPKLTIQDEPASQPPTPCLAGRCP